MDICHAGRRRKGLWRPGESVKRQLKYGHGHTYGGVCQQVVRMTRRKVVRAASRVVTTIGGKVRRDGASFIGAAICMLSLFLPWIMRELPFWRYRQPPRFALPKLEWTFFDLVVEPGLTLMLLVFLVGIIISLFHRAGVIPQAVGLLGFAMVARSHFLPAGIVRTSMDSYFFGPGYFVALAGLFISMFAARNFWWQRRSHAVVPSISRITALSPNSTRAGRH